VYLVRVPKEERMMIEQFGEPYQDYMRRVGGIFPKLNRVP
jgi:protein-S-isoprenylcysteine O-methyltransferase Ste14